MGDRYFVRAHDDAAEKGPYEIEVIKSSFSNGMLKGSATCRHENGTSTLTVAALLGIEGPKPRGSREGDGGDGMRRSTLAELERARMQRSQGGSGNMTVGIVMVVIGVVLTVVSFGATGGGGVVFIGLVVFGFIRIIRGASER